jgi:diaminohydroxyphosphoribosylaminopyrimidine deaminase / 5-amino-6-(5-phosphoribosylamino)uracil reductase
VSDSRFMSRALELAREVPYTSPNPRVGAVVVRDGEIVAEGAHRGVGTLHAEAVALANADARGATMYVNLEPCAHHGNTPPCAPAVVDAGIARVVVGIEDPDERVRGKGIELLRSRGLQVEVGVLAAEAEWLNAPYLHHRATGRSYLSLKLALTLDGRMSAPDGTSRWITGEQARRWVHRRRLEADAVLVGSGTVAVDDPSLDVRDVAAGRQPVVLVVDSRGRTSAAARIFDRGHVVMATTVNCPHDRQMSWKEAGADVWVLQATIDGVDLDELITEAGKRGLVEIFCEGGAELATKILRRRLLDRLELHVGPKMTGAGGAAIGDLGVGTMADALGFELVENRVLDGDLLAVYRKAA